MIRYRILFVITISIICLSCRGQENNPFASAEPIPVIRFDKALFSVIETNDTLKAKAFSAQYPEMMAVTGLGILNMRSTEMPGFYARLLKYYSEPNLKRLYGEAVARYDSIADLEKELGVGFACLKAELPGMPVPKIYAHVSGLSQNILVAEGLLSVSIDKYMGKDYPLYQNFFNPYQLEKMQRANIVPDCLAGWLMSEYVFKGKDNVLLERMIYQGKMKYIVSKALPDTQPRVLMGYTPEQEEWCKANEGTVWKAIIDNKHLYTPDITQTNNYFQDTPNPLYAPESPGNLGVWMGWRIVKRYMELTGAPVEELLNADAQSILSASKYKPL